MRPYNSTYLPLVYGACYGSVDIATRYGTEESGDRIHTTANFFVASVLGPEAQPASCTNGTGSAGIQLPKRRADHPLPPPFSAGLRLGWNYTSASPLCLHRHVMRRPLPYTIGIHGPLTCAVGYCTQCCVSSRPQKIVPPPHHTNKYLPTPQ